MHCFLLALLKYCLVLRNNFAEPLPLSQSAAEHCRLLNLQLLLGKCYLMVCKYYCTTNQSLCKNAGFTKLTELLSKRHAAGIELLTKCINNYFAQIIETVLLHNGNVMRFAGDAIICCFCPLGNEAEEEADGGLRAAVLRCMRCTAALASNLGALPFSARFWCLKVQLCIGRRPTACSQQPELLTQLPKTLSCGQTNEQLLEEKQHKNLGQGVSSVDSQ